MIRARYQQKYDYEINWNKATTFVPLLGEMIIYRAEIDDDGDPLPAAQLPSGRTTPILYPRIKVGDGVTVITDLPFADVATKIGNSNIGSASQPIYIGAGGAPLAGDTYAGGTQVTLNNSAKNGQNATFYAPTSGGTSGYILKSNGSTSAPTWTPYTNAAMGQGYGTCGTAAATTAKAVTMSGYTLVSGGIVSVKFTYAVPASATMNINSKGAKYIKYRNANITANMIQAGDIATFIYDGSSYHLLTVDRWNPDTSNLITIDDIDAICGTTMEVASAYDRSVTF